MDVVLFNKLAKSADTDQAIENAYKLGKSTKLSKNEAARCVVYALKKEYGTMVSLKILKGLGIERLHD